MKKLVVLITISIVIFSSSLNAQWLEEKPILMLNSHQANLNSEDEIAIHETQNSSSIIKALQEPVLEPNINVKYYKLDLKISTPTKYLRGYVIVNAE